MVTFTSVGYADVVLTRDWRMPKIKGIKGSGKIKKSRNIKAKNQGKNQGKSRGQSA
jgi:hypothetical protein